MKVCDRLRVMKIMPKSGLCWLLYTTDFDISDKYSTNGVHFYASLSALVYKTVCLCIPCVIPPQNVNRSKYIAYI